MTAKADYLEDKLLNWALRATAMGTAPANVYLALFTSATSDAGGGTEVANSSGYARLAVSTTGSFSAPSGGAVSNTAELAFAAASGGNWGTITHVAIIDSGTYGAGNWLYHGPLTAAKVVNDGDIFRFAAGALVISEA